MQLQREVDMVGSSIDCWSTSVGAVLLSFLGVGLLLAIHLRVKRRQVSNPVYMVCRIYLSTDAMCVYKVPFLESTIVQFS